MTHPAQDAQHTDITHGFVAMLLGVSGTGKTTLGELLGKRLDADFKDADDFHSDGRFHSQAEAGRRAAAAAAISC